MLHTVAKGLDYLLPNVVFVGGSVTELYATDTAATEVRPTEDVDCVVELAAYSKLDEFENTLRKLKFTNDTESGIICRWKYAGVTVDIMPNGAAIFGFSNEWYKKGMAHTLQYNFEDGISIRYFAPAYYLASKFTAMNDRGGNDLRISSDLEDIVYVLDNRVELIQELANAENDVAAFLSTECLRLILRKTFLEEIACAMPLNSGDERIQFVIDRINNISELAKI